MTDSRARGRASLACRLDRYAGLLVLPLLAGCTGILSSSGPGGSNGSGPSGIGTGAGLGTMPGAGSGGAAPGSAALPGAEVMPDAAEPDLNLPPDANLPCVAGADASAPSRLWRLTRLQLQNTLREFYRGIAPRANDNPLEGMILPFGTVAAGDRFSARTISYGLDEPSFRDLMAASAEVGRRLAAEASEEVCVGSADFAICVATLMAKAGQLAYRRPLTQQEVQQYASVATTQKAAGVADAEAVAQALQAILMAPEVNFRLEAGAAGAAGRMDPYAVATALAYGLTDGPPDAELAAAAANGGLVNAADIALQVRRLIGDQGGAKRNPDQTAPIFYPSPTERFLQEYFRYDKVERVDKSMMTYGWYRSWAMLEDTKRLVSQTLSATASGGLFEALFTGTTVYVESNTKDNYGLVGDFFNREKADIPGRAGMMTQPSWPALISDRAGFGRGRG